MEEYEAGLSRHEEKLRRINNAIDRGDDEEIFHYVDMATPAAELDYMIEAFGIEI
jgi:hypothetical protein